LVRGECCFFSTSGGDTGANGDAVGFGINIKTVYKHWFCAASATGVKTSTRALRAATSADKKKVYVAG